MNLSDVETRFNSQEKRGHEFAKRGFEAIEDGEFRRICLGRKSGSVK